MFCRFGNAEFMWFYFDVRPRWRLYKECLKICTRHRNHKTLRPVSPRYYTGKGLTYDTIKCWRFFFPYPRITKAKSLSNAFELHIFLHLRISRKLGPTDDSVMLQTTYSKTIRICEKMIFQHVYRESCLESCTRQHTPYEVKQLSSKIFFLISDTEIITCTYLKRTHCV